MFKMRYNTSLTHHSSMTDRVAAQDFGLMQEFMTSAGSSRRTWMRLRRNVIKQPQRPPRPSRAARERNELCVELSQLLDSGPPRTKAVVSQLELLMPLPPFSHHLDHAFASTLEIDDWPSSSREESLHRPKVACDSWGSSFTRFVSSTDEVNSVAH